MREIRDAICYPIAGFWVEVPDDGNCADLYLLPDHDATRGLEGRPQPFPVKRLPGKRDEAGKYSHPATLLAARVWAFHAREQITAGVEPDYDGDGQTPLGASPSLGALALSFDPALWGIASEVPSVALGVAYTEKDGKITPTSVSFVSGDPHQPPADPPAPKPKNNRRRKGA